MDVPRSTLEQVFTEITTSVGYITTVGPQDKAKISKRRAGVITPLPWSKLGRAAWRVAAMLSPVAPPPPPPPPPPPTFKKVAPITVTRQGVSDQRVCLFVNGNLRPGVFRRPDGTYGDESGAVYAANGDGLEDSGVRTKLPEGAFGLVKAKEMDNRSACECPTAGDPTKNTGSWTV